MASEAERRLHVLLFTLPAQGDINPMIRLAMRIAAKGPLVTFSTNGPYGRRIIQCAGVEAGVDGVPIRRGRLRYDFLDDDDAAELAPEEFFRHLNTVCPEKLASLIRRQAVEGRPVNCFVCTGFLPWAVDVAAGMGIPCGVLWAQSCTVQAIFFHFRRSPAGFPLDPTSGATVRIPGLPAITYDVMPTYLLDTYGLKQFAEGFLKQFDVLDKTSWIFANTFEALERDAIAVHAALGMKVIPVGPLVDGGDDGDDDWALVRGDLLPPDADCIGWLDRQTARSVIYASMGSLAKLEKEEMAEIAAALTSSGKPFLWVVRYDSRELLPEGFTAGERGMLVGWSPQGRVLNHGAVGCFLTHCGWNSTLDALSAGVPVIAFPGWGDQPMNAHLLVDVHRVGIQQGKPMRKEHLAAAIADVMDGPEAPAMRERAMAWRTAASATVADGGAADRNVQAFVDELSGMAWKEAFN